MHRWLLALILLWPPLLAANDYLDELTAQAKAKKLADERQWHALLHYKPRLLLPGVESQADDPAFFNAPNGKTDPEAELAATLAAFFSDLPETPTQQNPQCRFIARYHWLKEQLGFDPARLPEQSCQRYREWRGALNPDALTLVFPAAYLNNPASLYGHTLLRVDAKNQDERTRLLAYAINYAAATNETSGLAFAVNGIFGGYPGLFSISPYYAKVKEYNDLENRDIWEYELDFTPEEIERLLMHAWELGPIHFDYYFFDENCSYYVLALFDVARPSLRLTDRFPLWVIPADTVRVVTEEPGLLRRAVYRPARSTILSHRQQRMTPARVRLARAVARGETAVESAEVAALSEEERARVLELAYEYLEYERLRGKTKDAAATAARLRELLLVRSRIAVGDDAPPPVPAVRPDQSHGSARISLRVGEQNRASFQEIHLRPAYHDLLDPEPGFNRGAAIEFLGVTLRHHNDSDKTRVQALDFINITSLAARNELLKPLSWKVNFGFKRKRLPLGQEPLVFRLLTGAGLAHEVSDGLLTYAMVETAVDVNSRLEHDYALGAGPAVGLLWDITGDWRAQLEARSLRYGVGDAHTANEVRLQQRLSLGANSALHLEVLRRREFREVTREAMFGWSYYF